MNVQIEPRILRLAQAKASALGVSLDVFVEWCVKLQVAGPELLDPLSWNKKTEPNKKTGSGH